MDLLWAIAVSGHLGMEGDHNSIHPHIRLFKDGYIAGAYYNSEDTISAYAGYRLEPINQAGIEIGLATGYSAFDIVAPFARGTYDVGNTRFFVVPGFENHKNKTNIGVVIGVELQLK